jgi:replicative DNA helicase
MGDRVPLALNKAQLAEQYIIGSVLLDEGCIDIAMDIVSPQDFASPMNQVIFSAMCELCKAGKSINSASIMTIALSNPIFANNDGVAYLCSCASSLPSACNIEQYASIVRSESLQRKLISFSERIRVIDYNALDSIDAEIAKLSDELMNLTSSSVVNPWSDFKTALSNTCEELMSEESTKGLVYSGFVDIDAKMPGFRPGSLTIIAARPAMGKTALGLNILKNAAINQEVPSVFFSLEMTTIELVNRLLSSLALVNGNAIRQKKMSDGDWASLMRVIELHRGAKIFIDETPGIDISVLRERARRLYRQNKIGLIIVDYLQLMHASGKQIQNREQEISTISRGLKGIAKELHIPVIALSQLNRALDSRTDKRPILSDLRESGAIEQDADNILFIHREDYYKPNDPPTNIAEVIIAKQRSGPTGLVKLHWRGEYTQFTNLAHEFQED